MKQNRLTLAATWLYMAVAAGFLCWNLARMTEFSWTFALMPQLGNIACVAAVVFHLCFRKKPSVTVVLMSAGLVWMAAMTAIRGENAWNAEKGNLQEGVTAFLLLTPLPGIVGMNRFRQFLKGVLAIWVTAMTYQAAIGLWAAFGGHAVFSMRGTWYIGMNLGDHRLYLNAYVTTGAVKLGMTMLLTVLLGLLSRTRRARILCAAAACVQGAALALTDCRTAFLALGVALGLGAWLLLRQKKPGKHELLRLLALTAVMTLVCYGGLSGFLTLTASAIQEGPLDNLNLLELPAHMISGASAEEAVADAANGDNAVAHREIDPSDVFNGRSAIWRGALRLLRAEPKLLLTGTSAPLAVAMMNLYTEPGTMFFQHAHNLYLQVLVCWGIPGLLLLLGGVGRYGLCAVRLIRSKKPLWMAFLAAVVLYLLICELVDCFTMLSTGSPMLYFLCLMLGAVETLSQKEQKAC